MATMTPSGMIQPKKRSRTNVDLDPAGELDLVLLELGDERLLVDARGCASR